MAPKWYQELSEIAPLIASKDWAPVHIQAKELTKELYTKAPTVKTQFENVVLLTINPVMAEASSGKIEQAYAKALVAADKELDTDDFSRVMKEEQLADRLDVLSAHIVSSTKIIYSKGFSLYPSFIYFY